MGERLGALNEWLRDSLGLEVTRLAPASADASFRRYFRVHTSAGTSIAMDAPPEREDCRQFIRVAGLLREAGLNAPRVLAHDPQKGFLLLTDLGTESYLDVLDEGNADHLFADALRALVQWQRASRAGVLPSYDQVLVRRELGLFPEWYLRRHLGFEPDPRTQAILTSQFELLEKAALSQPVVFVHRDYMPRNLMISTPNPGILDFQDAVAGPITYDVVSLFRDAFISWEEARIDEWMRRYWNDARRSGLPVIEPFPDFQRALDWMGIQRHLKVLGIFARIRYRDGKPHYLEDAPRFLNYIRVVGARYPEFDDLLCLLEQMEAAGNSRDALT